MIIYSDKEIISWCGYQEETFACHKDNLKGKTFFLFNSQMSQQLRFTDVLSLTNSLKLASAGFFEEASNELQFHAMIVLLLKEAPPLFTLILLWRSRWRMSEEAGGKKATKAQSLLLKAILNILKFLSRTNSTLHNNNIDRGKIFVSFLFVFFFGVLVLRVFLSALAYFDNFFQKSLGLCLFLLFTQCYIFNAISKQP